MTNTTYLSRIQRTAATSLTTLFLSAYASEALASSPIAKAVNKVFEKAGQIPQIELEYRTEQGEGRQIYLPDFAIYRAQDTKGTEYVIRVPVKLAPGKINAKGFNSKEIDPSTIKVDKNKALTLIITDLNSDSTTYIDEGSNGSLESAVLKTKEEITKENPGFSHIQDSYKISGEYVGSLLNADINQELSRRKEAERLAKEVEKPVVNTAEMEQLAIESKLQAEALAIEAAQAKKIAQEEAKQAEKAKKEAERLAKEAEKAAIAAEKARIKGLLPSPPKGNDPQENYQF